MTRSAFIAAAAAFLAVAALSAGPTEAATHQKGITLPSASATMPKPRPRPAGPAHVDVLPTLC